MSKKNYNVFSDEPLKNHIQKSKEKQTAYYGGVGKYPMYLAIKPDQEAEVRFLKEEPIKFYQHRVFDSDLKNGMGGYRVLTCTRRDDCPLCVADDRPSFKVAWEVVHLDHTDEDGNEVPRVKLWVQGIRFAEMFQKKTKRFDITKENVILERIGGGTNTTYSIERTNEDGEIQFDKDELTDLEEYFGLDDDKYKAMVRIGESMSSSDSNPQADSFNPRKASNRSFEPPRKRKSARKRHPADDSEDNDESQNEGIEDKPVRDRFNNVRVDAEVGDSPKMEMYDDDIPF